MSAPLNKSVAAVVGAMVVALIIMGTTIGYLYGLKPATITQTNTFTETMTKTSSTTLTSAVTDTVTTSTTLIKTVSLTQTKTTTFTATTTILKTLTSTVTPPFEKLEIVSAYGEPGKVVINITNVGTVDATISQVFVNGRPLDPNKITPATPFLLKTGDSIQVQLDFSTAPLSLGETYDFRIHTGSGSDYAQAIMIS